MSKAIGITRAQSLTVNFSFAIAHHYLHPRAVIKAWGCHFDRRKRRLYWEEKWSRRDYNPEWLDEGPRPQVVSAVEEGWMTPGQSVLDIGCGMGNIAIWLSEQGFDVLGIDVAHSAIERARRTASARSASARFEVTDVSRRSDPGHTFDVLLDLGCLHQLPETALAHYCRNLERWSHSTTRILLLMKTWNDAPGKPLERVRDLLSPLYLVESVEEVNLAPSTSKTLRTGICIRLTRSSD